MKKLRTIFAALLLTALSSSGANAFFIGGGAAQFPITPGYLGCVGDSRCNNSFALTTASASTYLAQRFLGKGTGAWTDLLSGSRYLGDNNQNFGIGGQTSCGIFGRINNISNATTGNLATGSPTDVQFNAGATGSASAVSDAANVYFYLAGTNDSNAYAAYSGGVVNSMTCAGETLDALGAAGKIVFLANEIPRGVADIQDELQTPSSSNNYTVGIVQANRTGTPIVFDADEGVSKANGAPLTKVVGAPSAGQYSVSASTVSTTGTWSSGSTSITVASATGLAVGQTLTGTGLVPSTSQLPTTTFTATYLNGATTLTNNNGAAVYAVGQGISGLNIPANDFITNVNGNILTLNAATTGSGTSQTITVQTSGTQIIAISGTTVTVNQATTASGSGTAITGGGGVYTFNSADAGNVYISYAIFQGAYINDVNNPGSPVWLVTFHEWLQSKSSSFCSPTYTTCYGVPGALYNRPWVVSVDTWDKLIDPATVGSTYANLPGTEADGIHPSSYGGELMMGLVDTYLNLLYPAANFSNLPTTNNIPTFTGTFTSNSPTITSVSNISGLVNGQSITGPEIAAGTTISSFSGTAASCPTGCSITMSQNSSGAGTAKNITVGLIDTNSMIQDGMFDSTLVPNATLPTNVTGTLAQGWVFAVDANTTTALAPLATFTCTETASNNVCSSVSSFTNVQNGYFISGTGVPANTYITNFDPVGNTITTNNNLTGTGSQTITPVKLLINFSSGTGSDGYPQQIIDINGVWGGTYSTYAVGNLTLTQTLSSAANGFQTILTPANGDLARGTAHVIIQASPITNHLHGVRGLQFTTELTQASHTYTPFTIPYTGVTTIGSAACRGGLPNPPVSWNLTDNDLTVGPLDWLCVTPLIYSTTTTPTGSLVQFGIAYQVGQPVNARIIISRVAFQKRTF